MSACIWTGGSSEGGLTGTWCCGIRCLIHWTFTWLRCCSSTGSIRSKGWWWLAEQVGGFLGQPCVHRPLQPCHHQRMTHLLGWIPFFQGAHWGDNQHNPLFLLTMNDEHALPARGHAWAPRCRQILPLQAPLILCTLLCSRCLEFCDGPSLQCL